MHFEVKIRHTEFQFVSHQDQTAVRCIKQNPFLAL